jgi:hypothetical protein
MKGLFTEKEIEERKRLLARQERCTHDSWFHPPIYQDDYTGEWVTPVSYKRSTTEDIDTGRFRCTQCGKVFYYTGRWKEHYEGKD